MSAGITTGGPAFPCDGIVRRDDAGRLHGHEVSATGLSTRDYFAAKAMQAYLNGHLAHYGQGSYWAPKDIASEAYAVADAMLRAREGGAS